MLRGARADAAAHAYLSVALADGCPHELVGLSILAWAQGIPRAAFERVLAGFQLERELREPFGEWFVRLLPAVDRSKLAEHERVIVDGLDELTGGWPP
jgi:hypothetical protein